MYHVFRTYVPNAHEMKVYYVYIILEIPFQM